MLDAARTNPARAARHLMALFEDGGEEESKFIGAVLVAEFMQTIRQALQGK